MKNRLTKLPCLLLNTFRRDPRALPDVVVAATAISLARYRDRHLPARLNIFLALPLLCSRESSATSFETLSWLNCNGLRPEIELNSANLEILVAPHTPLLLLLASYLRATD